MTANCLLRASHLRSYCPRLGALAALLITSSVCFGGCGARSDLEVLPPSLPASFRRVEECSEPSWVPSGNAYIGGVRIGSKKDKREGEPRPGMVVLPAACSDSRALPPVMVKVPGYFLDRDEASVGCLDACIADGECDANAQPNRSEADAVAADEAMAEQLCAYRGGRLPTYPELARAGQDNAISLGPLELLLRFAHCVDAARGAVELDWEGEACQRLLYRSPYVSDDEAEWLAQLKPDPEDVGPFGHRDLFGAQIELTSTHTAIVEETGDGAFDPAYCENSIVEDQDFGDQSLAVYGPAFSLSRGERSFLEFQEGFGWNVSPFPAYTLGNNRYAIGFRCAFDLEEQDVEE